MGTKPDANASTKMGKQLLKGKKKKGKNAILGHRRRAFLVHYGLIALIFKRNAFDSLRHLPVDLFFLRLQLLDSIHLAELYNGGATYLP